MASSHFYRDNNFKIGPILVDPSRNILSFDSNIHSLEPRVMDVLVYLAQHAGTVCSRHEIISAIWNVEYGADESLTRAISVIRKNFRKAGGRGRYIQTISKRGYSLLEIPVAVAENDDLAKVKTAIKTVPKLALPRQESAVLSAKDMPVRAVSFAKPRVLLPLAAVSAFGLIGFAAFSTLNTDEAAIERVLQASAYGRSVVVMPFTDMSENQDQKYFSDGMSEELLNELSQISSLRVLGRGSISNEQRDNLSYFDVGARYKVSHIIDGSVRKQGERVKVSAQLINTHDSRQVWSESYLGVLDDVFDLQERISKDIAAQLTLLLSIEIEPPVSLEALSPPIAVVPEPPQK